MAAKPKVRDKPLIAELAQFLWQRKAWWLAPIIIILVIAAILIIIAQSSSVSPFVYVLF